jgi:hypothetical protein
LQFGFWVHLTAGSGEHDGVGSGNVEVRAVGHNPGEVFSPWVKFGEINNGKTRREYGVFNWHDLGSCLYGIEVKAHNEYFYLTRVRVEYYTPRTPGKKYMTGWLPASQQLSGKPQDSGKKPQSFIYKLPDC